MKKLLLLSCCTLLWTCQTFDKQEQALTDFIPQNTTVVFHANDFNILKNALTNQPLLSKAIPLWSELKNSMENMVPTAMEAPAIFCLTPVGKNQTAISIIYRSQPTDSLVATPNTDSFLYSSQTIEKVTKKSRSFYRTKMGDVNYLSDSQIVIENSIRNFENKSKGIQEVAFYKLIEGIDKNAPLNIFIHSDAAPLFATVFPKIPLFPKMGSNWAAYDFNTKRDPFTLDGMLFVNDSLPQELSLIKNLKPKLLQTPQIVPNAFTAYLALTVSDIKTLEDNFKVFSRFQNIPLKAIDFNAFSTVDEIAWITQKQDKAVVFHVTNPEAFPYATNAQKQKSYRAVSYSKQLLPENMVRFMEHFGIATSPAWVFQLEDFFVFAESEKILQSIINNFKDQKVLANNPNFKSLKKELANNCSFLWVGNTASLQEYWQQVLSNKSLLEALPSEMYPYVAFQAVGEEGFVQARFTAQKDQSDLSNTTGAAQYNFVLDAEVATTPQWLKNHRTKTMDVAVQDVNNVLYLFSNTGTLFWKKQLPDAIIGPIQQVDLYRNKRLQMAFRTKDRLMVLDRNGKVVPPFDKKIPGTTPVQPLAVFDYDLNRNYRFLLSHGTDLMMLDGKGNRVRGFGLNKLTKPLLSTPKHLRMNGKDYILFQQSNGILKITDRKGADRVTPKETFDFGKNPVFSYYNTFATTDTKGDLIQIDTNGNVIRTPLNLDAEHTVDMTGRSLVTLSGNALNIKGIPVSLPEGNYTAPKIFYLNDTLFIALTDVQHQKLYLYYSDGTLVNGFPVYGGTPIDLVNADGDAALELVTQSGENGLLIYEVRR